MDSAQYWKEAAEAREAAVHLEAKGQVEKLLRLYEDAYKDIQSEIEKIRYNYSLRFGIDKETAEYFLSREINKDRMGQLAELLLKAESDEERAAILEFIHKDGLSTRAYGARAGRYKELEDVISLRMMALQAEVRELGKDIIKTAYKNNYYRFIDDIAFGLDAGVSFTLIDDEALDAVVNKPWYGKRFSERVWKNTQRLADEAQEIVGRYIISGRSQTKAIQELADRFDVAQTDATTLIRTEIAHARSQGDLKVYEELDIADVQFIATLDELTCKKCGPLDGKIIKRSEIREGENYPTIHPRCRCTSCAAARAMSRLARDIRTGRNVKIDGSITYEQWRDGMSAEEKAAFDVARKRYVNKAADKLQHSRYREVLGRDVPRGFDNFQNLKYNDSEKWRFIRLDYRRQNTLIRNPELVLPNAKAASVDDRKFTGYLFNPENARGHAKGQAFSNRLGYDMNNYEELKKEILLRAEKYPSKMKNEDEYGISYEQKMVMYGKKDKPANVVVGWKVKDSSTWMTSAYIKEID